MNQASLFEDDKNPFEASASMLGYFYQVRYALYLMLKFIKDGDLTKQVKIEGLDDIDLRQGKDILQLLQTKHLTSKNKLTNGSKHFWKTINIWSQHIAKGIINTDNVSLNFVINSEPSKNSVIDLLSRDEKNIELILSEMNEITEISKNKDNQNGYNNFKILTIEQKKWLLKSIKVLALQPDIEKLLEEEMPKLFIGRCIWNYHIENFTKDLDAWWTQLVIKQLTDGNINFISAQEIDQKMNRLRDKYTENKTSIDYLDTDEINKNLLIKENIDDTRQFITQLKRVGFVRFEQVKQDYYKASFQRSKWLENYKFENYEENLKNYNKQLINEWNNECDLHYKNFTDEEDMQTTGKKIYQDLADKKILFRDVQENYMMRGSYHILADEKPKPEIYWHPKFLEFLENENKKC